MMLKKYFIISIEKLTAIADAKIYIKIIETTYKNSIIIIIDYCIVFIRNNIFHIYIYSTINKFKNKKRIRYLEFKNLLNKIKLKYVFN